MRYAREILKVFTSFLGGFFAVWAAFGFQPIAVAKDWLAAGLAVSDLQNAQTAASSGDTIFLPEGTATWTTGFTCTKNIHWIGAGDKSNGRTVITSDPALTGMWDCGQTASWVQGIKFNCTSSVGSSYCVIVRFQNVRVSDCWMVGVNAKIIGVYTRAASSGQPPPTGVTWNCQMDDARNDNQGDAVGNAAWFDSTIVPGGLVAWFTEDSNVRKLNWDIGKNGWDNAYGATTVVRYNTITDYSVFGHGHDSTTNTDRGTRLVEVYNNNFIHSTYAIEQPVRCNSGTVIIEDNTLTGTFSAPANVFDVALTTISMGGHTGADWPLIDQPGRQLDSSLWSSAGSPPASQGAFACYEKNNPVNGGASMIFLISTNGSATYLTLGRDVFNDTYAPRIRAPYPHPLRGYRFPGRKNRCATIYH